jgi:hypothetical protein
MHKGTRFVSLFLTRVHLSDLCKWLKIFRKIKKEDNHVAQECDLLSYVCSLYIALR